jgi:PPOX class probable F420-dependent enzyme
MAKLTDQQREFLANPFVGTATTLRSDGSPHNTVVWIEADDDAVSFNTAEGRAKPKHLRRDPRVAITVVDPQNPYRWISVNGRAELTHEDADAQIDRLAKKYIDKDVYPWHKPEEQRVTVRISPEQIDATGFDDAG